MEEDISPTSLNGTAESSSKFRKQKAPGEIFLKPGESTVKCFDSSIYYFVLILGKLRYVFSKK